MYRESAHYFPSYPDKEYLIALSIRMHIWSDRQSDVKNDRLVFILGCLREHTDVSTNYERAVKLANQHPVMFTDVAYQYPAVQECASPLTCATDHPVCIQTLGNSDKRNPPELLGHVN